MIKTEHVYILGPSLSVPTYTQWIYIHLFTKGIFTSIHRALAIVAQSDNYICQIATGIESKLGYI